MMKKMQGFHLQKLLKHFCQEFVTCWTYQMFFKLLENQLTARLKILQLKVRKSC